MGPVNYQSFRAMDNIFCTEIGAPTFLRKTVAMAKWGWLNHSSDF